MTLFTDKAPGVMMLLMKDFNLTDEEAAAILGNLGTESGGFKYSQEIKPIGNGRGGLGWAQWTGPRRVQFESYCKRNNLDPVSDKANYAWLWVELSDEYQSALTGIKNAKTLYDKVVAFELKFERAGVKNYASRFDYAQKALAAYRANVPKPTIPVTTPQEQQETPVQSTTPTSSQSWFITFLKWIFIGHS